MKKLKRWQFILLVIFYPIGICYFIIWLIYGNRPYSPSFPYRAPTPVMQQYVPKYIPTTYQKQSKIVSIFTQKWRNICKNEYVALDFETTGLDKIYDRIIEVAAIRYINGQEANKFVTLVNPQMRIPVEAQAVNHISNGMVRNAPPENVVIPQLIDFLGDSLIVGHNVNFDVSFLEIAAQRCGRSVIYRYIDTISVSKKIFPGLPNYKLSTIASFLQFDTSRLHRAEADVRICAEIISIALNSLE